MALYAWAFDRSHGKSRWMRVMALAVVLCISEWELYFTRFYVYPASVLMATILLFEKKGPLAWAEVLTGALLGGLLCWKVADSWPLMPGLPLLCAALLLVPVVPLCQNREDRFLAIGLGGLFFELFFCLREYMLFSFCVIRLGSREALSLSAASLCLYFVLESIVQDIRAKAKGSLSAAN